MIFACCSFNILVIRCALTWIDRTVRISCLTVVDPNRKVPDLYFKVMDPKLQVADLKAEVWKLIAPVRSQLEHLRSRGHNFILPLFTKDLYKRSFVMRCLFDYVHTHSGFGSSIVFLFGDII